MAGADQRRGALVGEAAAEGSPKPEENLPNAAANIAASPSRKRSPMKRERKRVRICNIRLSDDEWQRLTAAARTVRTSLPAYLVRAGLAAAQDPDTTAAAIAGQRELVTELFTARRHLAHVGNNLNQVARAINAGGRPADVDAVIAEVHRAARRVHNAVDQILART